MKILTIGDANSYLNNLNFKIGDWNGIVYKSKNHFQTTHRAPRDAGQLFRFSQLVASWLPQGNWKIFQIDNSTSLNAVEASFVDRLLGNSVGLNFNLLKNRTMFFEFKSDNRENENVELQISFLIFLFLLFEHHAYLVSSGCDAGQLLGIQDGSIVFSSLEENIFGAHKLLKQFDAAPSADPAWIQKIIREGQERDIKGEE